MHIHPPQTRHQIHRTKSTISLYAFRIWTQVMRWSGNLHQNSTQRSQLGQYIVDLIIRIRHFDTDLREVIRVGSTENLFVMIQILSHGDEMILNVGEVETDIGFGGYEPLFVA